MVRLYDDRGKTKLVETVGAWSGRYNRTKHALSCEGRHDVVAGRRKGRNTETGTQEEARQ